MSDDEFSLGPFDRDEKSDPRRRWFNKLSKGGATEDTELEPDHDMDQITALRKRLRILEERVQDSGKVMIEDEQRVAGVGQLGGKITANQNGTIRKTSLVVVCDGCGYPLQGPPAICPVDKRKVCIDCMTSIDQQDMCKGCLMRTRPLSKQSYKVLLMMSFSIDNQGMIRELTKMLRDDIMNSFGSMLESGYIARRGLSGFDITERGINVLVAYKSIYGDEEDIVNLVKGVKLGFGVL